MRLYASSNFDKPIYLLKEFSLKENQIVVFSLSAEASELTNLTRMAEESNNPQIVKQAKALEKQVSEMRQSIGELERENANKTEENKSIQKINSQVRTENIFLRSDVNANVAQLTSLHHQI